VSQASLSSNKNNNGFKSAQRIGNFVNAGQSISGFVNDTKSSRNGAGQKDPNNNLEYINNVNHANIALNNNISNLPTHYSSSRFQNYQPAIGSGLAPSGPGGFGVLSNYNRNQSPSGGPAQSNYLAMGLSEANSTSFYSNNSSTISNNLSNSRYLQNRKENQMLANGMS
jgi:hypothetical protein